MSDFAPPASKLAESGIGVAAAPTGGLGVALTPDGKLPANVAIMDTSGVARRISFGVTSITWPGGAQFSDTVVVSHNLGTSPACVVVGATLPPGSTAYEANIVTWTSTTISLRAHTTDGTSPALGTITDAHWIAIG